MGRARYKFIDPLTNELAEIIEFDLIDNPGCRAWQCAVMLNAKTRELGKLPPVRYLPPPDDIHEIYDQLKSTVIRLNATEFPVGVVIPDSFDQADQYLMNHLHSRFTESCARLWDLRYPGSESHKESLNAILCEFNAIIHRLEMYMATPRKIHLVEHYSQEEVHVTCSGREIGYDIFPFRRFHSFDQADLIIDGYILGKTLLESFACDDRPTQWDTNGHMRTNGGAVITAGDLRQQIYNSNEFNEWLQQHHVKKHDKRADFPLGYFAPGQRTKMEALTPEILKYSCSIELAL